VTELGRGRMSTVHALDEQRVLRLGGAPEREARVMAHARAAGYPVPEVLEVRADGLVLERIAGPTMLADLRRRPWRLGRHARLLAGLHERLHRIPWDGATLLHRDLHPDNVLLSPSGPVVIDWTNAGSGPPELDVALTWVIVTTSGGRGGRVFGRAFRSAAGAAAIADALADAVAIRSADPNVTDGERAAVRALLPNG
jgi:aminoglycoside phosphotransferase (APT) family kinase protein